MPDEEYKTITQFTRDTLHGIGNSHRKCANYNSKAWSYGRKDN